MMISQKTREFGKRCSDDYISSRLFRDNPTLPRISSIPSETSGPNPIKVTTLTTKYVKMLIFSIGSSSSKQTSLRSDQITTAQNAAYGSLRSRVIQSGESTR